MLDLVEKPLDQVSGSIEMALLGPDLPVCLAHRGIANRFILLRDNVPCGTASLWHMSTRFPSTSRELLRNLLPRHERALGALDVIWWRKHQRLLLR